MSKGIQDNGALFYLPMIQISMARPRDNQIGILESSRFSVLWNPISSRRGSHEIPRDRLLRWTASFINCSLDREEQPGSACH
jgi:hypothetical protein